MELTDPPPHDPHGTLVWEPATAAEDARLGPDSSALVDYLLHPPQIQVQVQARMSAHKQLSGQHLEARSTALEALIDAAFAP